MEASNAQNISKKAPASAKAARNSAHAERIRAIAYSMDTLVPGVYAWFGPFTIRLGGCTPDDRPYPYPGTLHSQYGLALVLPGYRIFTTYQGTYDPGQASN
ncbi:hypothetical protein [Altericista sp. CCNU0014]|uniref:hypothetical protein n=1 Tax=Altericista sp. CCNU0014 TaxID=3082949 RepID=UPI00384AA8B6